MQTVVVMEARMSRAAGGVDDVWAWCHSDGGVGFTSIGFTKRDGMTPHEPGENDSLVQLGKVLFILPALESEELNDVLRNGRVPELEVR